jgi:transposase-like protein
MARFPRKADGRRIFTADFKQEQIGRVLRGELTIAELSRRMGIAPSLLQRWKRSASGTPAAPDASLPYATPVTRLRPEQYIRELQLLVGKQTVELVLLRAELDALKSRRRARGVSGR